MRFDETIQRLERQLRTPLPGAAAHALLAPRPRADWPDGFNPARIRQAASLLLLVPIDDRPHVVLTVRADHLGRHGGQVSLPGGVVETGETMEQAALREAQEEIGLDVKDVRMLGRLTPLDIPVSGFRVHPTIGATGKPPLLVPADDEVAQILEVPVDELAAAGSMRITSLLRSGRSIEAPAFEAGGVTIWGATAMVLAEFLTLLGWPGPQ